MADFNVDVNIRANGTEKIDALERQLDKIKSETVSIKVNTTGLSEIKSIQNKIKSQSVNLKINTTGTQTLSQAKSDFQMLKNLANEISSKRISIAKLDSTKNSQQISTLTMQLKKLESDYTHLYSILGKDLNVNQIGQLENIFGKASDKVAELNAKSKDLASNLSKAARPISTMEADTAANKTLSWLNANTKAAKEYESVLKNLAEKQRQATDADQLSQYNKEFRQIVSEAQMRGLTGKSPMDEFKRAVRQIAEFAGVYGMIQNVAFEVPRQMVQDVQAVDAAMTQLQMATGVSDSQAQQLMSTYSQLGDQLKATSTDVAASATEWLKQGKSIAESEKLAQDSIVLSKIGDLSSEEATKTITAAMKSYDLDESGVMDFVDQISAIDMESATDVGGLSTAFNEVAANARQAGVEAEKVLAYAAAIGETTQEGMASVGTSLNAIFSRMGNIKLSRLKDPESGEDLNIWGAVA